MKFSLTYDGELLSASDKHTRVENKNRIRFELGLQLWEVWCNGNFERFQFDPNSTLQAANGWGKLGYAPLLTRKMNASCSLKIKFMRGDPPGQIIHGGDLDNRLKTLFDALRMPTDAKETRDDLAPEFYSREDTGICVCLLEDDALITDLAVETATVWTPMAKNHVRLVIDVEFRPFDFL